MQWLVYWAVQNAVIGLLSCSEGSNWFKEDLSVREGGTLTDIIFVYQNSLVIVIDVFLREEDWTEVIVWNR